jgi:hypothetical protein
MRMKLILPVVLLVGLGACVGGKITPAESILTACQTFNGALKTVATQNQVDPLSAAKVKRVDQAVDLSGGLCDGAAPDINASALDIAAVQGANIILEAVIGGN